MAASINKITNYKGNYTLSWVLLGYSKGFINLECILHAADGTVLLKRNFITNETDQATYFTPDLLNPAGTTLTSQIEKYLKAVPCF